VIPASIPSTYGLIKICLLRVERLEASTASLERTTRMKQHCWRARVDDELSGDRYEAYLVMERAPPSAVARTRSEFHGIRSESNGSTDEDLQRTLLPSMRKARKGFPDIWFRPTSVGSMGIDCCPMSGPRSSAIHSVPPGSILFGGPPMLPLFHHEVVSF
jgi:hypothetical protein